MPKIEFDCIICGKRSTKYTGSSKGKYCGTTCYLSDVNAKKYPKTCRVCDKDFLGSIRQVYCCKECKRKHDKQEEKQDFINICPRCGKQKKRFIAPYLMKHKLCPKCSSIQGKITNPPKSRERSHQWKGGKRTDGYGYTKLYIPEHPFADSTGYVREHLYVAEKVYGVEFIKQHGGSIHHIDGNKQNNDINNLHVCSKSQNSAFNYQLLEIAFVLVQKGYILFDSETKQYILNVDK